MTNNEPINTSGNSKLEATLVQAFEGSKESARDFFEFFLKGPLFVPKRDQVQQITNLAKYPNDFISVMALEGETVFVPVFSSMEKVYEWTNSELNCKEIDGKTLCERMPEDWWIAVNPGSEYEKEISPWEIKQLKFGIDGLAIIIDELFGEEQIYAAEIKSMKEHEFVDLKNALKTKAKSNKLIKKLFLLREIGTNLENDEQDKLSNLLLGVEVKEGSEEKFENIKEELKRHAALKLIGQESVKIRIGTNTENSVMLGIFKGEKPFYKQSFFSLFF